MCSENENIAKHFKTFPYEQAQEKIGKINNSSEPECSHERKRGPTLLTLTLKRKRKIV